MRWLLVAAAGILLLPGCGASDPNRDANLIASAIADLDATGASFTMDELIVETERGQKPTAGNEVEVQSTGTVRDGRAQMKLALIVPGGERDYDAVIADRLMYVRPQGAPRWRATTVDDATAEMAGLRLQLIREAALLARSVSGASLAISDLTFVQKYSFEPASEQLEQLLSATVNGAQETAFLKSAAVRVDAFLTAPENKLTRLDLHQQGTDPASGLQQKISSRIDYSTAQPVGAIKPPAEADMVDSATIFN